MQRPANLREQFRQFHTHASDWLKTYFCFLLTRLDYAWSHICANNFEYVYFAPQGDNFCQHISTREFAYLYNRSRVSTENPGYPGIAESSNFEGEGENKDLMLEVLYSFKHLFLVFGLVVL